MTSGNWRKINIWRRSSLKDVHSPKLTYIACEHFAAWKNISGFLLGCNPPAFSRAFALRFREGCSIFSHLIHHAIGNQVWEDQHGWDLFHDVILQHTSSSNIPKSFHLWWSKNGGLEDDFPFQLGDFQVLYQTFSWTGPIISVEKTIISVISSEKPVSCTTIWIIQWADGGDKTNDVNELRKKPLRFFPLNPGWFTGILILAH